MSPASRFFFVIGTTVAVCALYAGYLLSSKQHSADEVQAGAAPAAVTRDAEPLSFWSFSDLEGRERHMSEWAGELVVVNFWATWCPPCRKEIPGFVALQDQFSEQQVRFVGIALDRLEPVQTYAQEHGINYPVLVGEESVAQYMRALGNTIGALPFSALISRDGKILETHQGEWHQADLEAALRAAL